MISGGNSQSISIRIHAKDKVSHSLQTETGRKALLLRRETWLLLGIANMVDKIEMQCHGCVLTVDLVSRCRWQG